MTSLFARHESAVPAEEADGWFAGVPDAAAPLLASADVSEVRPVAQLRPVADRAPDDAVPVSGSVRAAGADAAAVQAAARARIAWTAPPKPGTASTDAGGEPDEVAPDAVAPEVRLAELDLLAVRRLARRGCSEWEIAELLRGHDAEPHEVEHVVEELQRRGYLDDAALARHLVESLHTRKGQSRAVIARELSARRIDQAVAAEALEAIDDDDELRRAMVVAEKRAGQLRSLDQATAERRLTAYLARRGYGSAIIREVCSRALAGSRRSGVSFR
ncbi:RecX family transcriptional regulator [Plantibacter flavus]|uniref:regulatory protein RecX n=1 Tax=Plantibacter flavus TaxID=150123 RepID=UPI003F176666